MARPVAKRDGGDVLRAVLTQQVSGCLVPQEMLFLEEEPAVVSLLHQSSLLVYELCLSVNFCLVARPGQTLADVRYVLAAPLALDTCAGFLLEANRKLAHSLRRATRTGHALRSPAEQCCSLKTIPFCRPARLAGRIPWDY